MTNAAKHSGASRCNVEIELDNTLGVTISDNGRGSVGRTDTGMGWTSMREPPPSWAGLARSPTERRTGLSCAPSFP